MKMKEGKLTTEQKLRQTIREIIKEQLNEAPKPIHHSDAKFIQVWKNITRVLLTQTEVEVLL